MDGRPPGAQNRPMNAPRSVLVLLAAAWLAPAAPAVPAVAPLAALAGEAVPDPAAAFATLSEEDLEADLVYLASPALQGRDSPSAGLDAAAEYIAERLEAAGYEGGGADGGFLRRFSRRLPAPVAERCHLALEEQDGGAPRVFELGVDYVPVWRTAKDAALPVTGELVVLGFGIDDRKQKYDDVTGKLRGKVVLIAEGEPRHRKKFEGPEVTSAGDLYEKLDALEQAGVAGVLVMRREPYESVADGAGPVPFGFRHTWASWAGHRRSNPVASSLVVLEVTPAAAEALSGEDVLERVRKVDKNARPPKPVETGRMVSLAADVELRDVPIPNVVGKLTGSDPELADEWVVLGAHYDHVGVDPRGRVGAGADDNASGTAALLEIAEALAADPPRRSVLVCAFAAEEDGLVGSKALVDDPPVPVDRMAAMLNMDMVGRGKASEVVVLGTEQNPKLARLLPEARKLAKTGVKTIVTGKGQDLFQRSDHYSFHAAGVPALFFFEGLPISDNEDYHTWRDTLDLVDIDKVFNTTRLVFNTAWLLANRDERPPPPR